MMIHSPVLVLNASYEPVSICAARRALTLVLKGVARAEESHDQRIWREMLLPSVIRLNRYRKVPHRRHEATRRTIFTRDQNTCQYCREVFASAKLTLDHVFPRSRGGNESWENLVACCSPCNRRKANRTPEEAAMPLLKLPRPLTLHTSRNIMRSLGSEDPKWRKYLYY